MFRCNKFGEKLREAREAAELSQKDLANKIGTSAAIIGRYERNERTPSVDIAKRLAEALGVSLDYLVAILPF